MDKLEELKANKAADDAAILEEEGPKFQHYSCSKQAMRLTTTAGKKISFTGKQFITDDEEIIEYLNGEIKAGLRTIMKGKLTAVKHVDPMAALRKRIIEEHEDAKAKAAAAPTQDFGSTMSPEALASRAKIATSKDVAS